MGPAERRSNVSGESRHLLHGQRSKSPMGPAGEQSESARADQRRVRHGRAKGRKQETDQSPFPPRVSTRDAAESSLEKSARVCDGGQQSQTRVVFTSER